MFGNDWLAARLAMGHGAYASNLINRMRRDRNESKYFKKAENIWKSKD